MHILPSPKQSNSVVSLQEKAGVAVETIAEFSRFNQTQRLERCILAHNQRFRRKDVTYRSQLRHYGRHTLDGRNTVLRLGRTWVKVPWSQWQRYYTDNTSFVLHIRNFVGTQVHWFGCKLIMDFSFDLIPHSKYREKQTPTKERNNNSLFSIRARKLILLALQLCSTPIDAMINQCTIG